MTSPRILFSSSLAVLVVLVAVPAVGLADTLGASVYVGARTLTLPERTSVVAELTSPLTSRRRDSAAGDLVRARVAEDVVVEGQVLVEAGAELLLAVHHARKAKMFGRRGHLELRGVSVRAVDGNFLPLDGFYERKGKGRKTVAATLTAAVAWPFAFLRGKHAVIPEGTLFETYLTESVEVLPRGQWAVLDMTRPYR